MWPTPIWTAAATTFCCKVFRSASTSCTRPRSTPPTPAAGRSEPEGFSWLYSFIKAQGERNYGKIYVRFPEAVSMREYLGPLARPDRLRRSRQTACAAEDVVRSRLADPASHAGERHRSGVGAAADHSRVGVDARPVASHPAGLAGLSRAQTNPDVHQCATAAHPRRRSRCRRHAVQRPSGHPGRQWPRTGVAHRSRERARRGVLPQLGDPRVPGDRRSSNLPSRTPGGPTAIGWKRFGSRPCGCAIC